MTKTDFKVAAKRKVDTGGVGSVPMKAATGDTLPRAGEGALLSALCSRGRISAHSVNWIRSSDATSRAVRSNSFPETFYGAIAPGTAEKGEMMGHLEPLC